LFALSNSSSLLVSELSLFALFFSLLRWLGKFPANRLKSGAFTSEPPTLLSVNPCCFPWSQGIWPRDGFARDWLLRHPHTDSRRPKHWIEAIGCFNGSYTRASARRAGCGFTGQGLSAAALPRRLLPVISCVIDAAW